MQDNWGLTFCSSSKGLCEWFRAGDASSIPHSSDGFSQVLGLKWAAITPLLHDVESCDTSNESYTHTWTIQVVYLSIPSSTTSPTKTLAIPAIAITTFWEIEHPVMVCINWNRKRILMKKKTKTNKQKKTTENEISSSVWRGTYAFDCCFGESGSSIHLISI